MNHHWVLLIIAIALLVAGQVHNAHEKKDKQKAEEIHTETERKISSKSRNT